MAIKIEKTFQVQEPLDRVWKFLSDPRLVAGCIPGAQVTEAVDERTYKGLIKVQVGPSVTDYRGEAHIELLDNEKHEIQMVGKGQDVRGKGSASMKMSGQARALSDGMTEVVTVSEVNVVGLLAQLGARMIQEVSNKMFEDFVANLRTQLQQQRATGTEQSTTSGTSAQAKPVQAVPLVLSIAKERAGRFFRRIFGGPGSE
ncbi:MAG TPA: SRPBCC family protein [Chthoniobacterales bacterium]|nr:SRPBCC family protein [Chthoniobacterales bacterium]